jgi:lysophospholipid acyltransferase
MIDFVNAIFAHIAPYVRLSVDQVKLVTILYTAVPLCAVLKRLPDDKPYLKNIFNIAYTTSIYNSDLSVSLFILVGVYDLWTGLWIILFSSLGTYALSFGLKGPLMPWVVFVFVMGQMSISQLIRQFNHVPDTVIDYTGSVFLRLDLILESK